MRHAEDMFGSRRYAVTRWRSGVGGGPRPGPLSRPSVSR